MVEQGKRLYEQGLASERAGNRHAAFDAYRRSAKIDPRIAAPYVGLSRILMLNHQRAEAIACLQRAINCEPQNHVLYTLLGQAQSRNSQLPQARQNFEKACTLNPDSSEAVLGLASVYEDQGDRAAASQVYEQLLVRKPEDVEAIAGWLTVADAGNLDGVIKYAEKRIRTTDNSETALIAYALGKAEARRGNHPAAMEAWESANEARRKVAGRFDKAAFDSRIAQLIELFSREFFASRDGWGVNSQTPVFIVGLPRSGTTLTEQILASHSQIFGAGELDLLTDLATGTPDLLGRPDPPWPLSALELGENHVAEIASQHLHRLQALASSQESLIVDKQPLNFWHLGLVALTFPNAAIIHCKRDIRDNGLSVFAENFTLEQRWSTDLDDIIHYWNGYRHLMDHWQAVSGLRFIEVEYEETVLDLKKQAQRLVGFLGLAFEENLLDFHNSERAVQTPSRWQVRRPLYNNSVGRWQHYQDQLKPLCNDFETLK